MIQQWGILGNDRKIDPVIYNNEIFIQIFNKNNNIYLYLLKIKRIKKK